MSKSEHLNDTRDAIATTLSLIKQSRALLALDNTAKVESARAIRGSIRHLPGTSISSWRRPL